MSNIGFMRNTVNHIEKLFNFNTLYQRIIISKWSIEKAFTSPIRSHQAINQRGRVGV